MNTKQAFVSGAGFGVAATLAATALLAAIFSHAPAFAAPATLPNAANQRNDTNVELRAIREAIEKQTALLDARLPRPEGN